MNLGFGGLAQLSTPALIALGALAVLQIVLDVVAFVDLYRRPVEQVVFGNKWVWVAIVLLVSTIGPILYLAIGRKAAPTTEVRPAAPASTRAESAADTLYGAPKDAERR